jgi:hypothetical protein
MKKIAIVLSLAIVASSAMAGFTPVNPQYHFGEPGIRGIMNKLYGQDNFVRVDDGYDSLWSYMAETGSAQFEAKFSAVGRATFGFFSGADAARFNPLFSVRQYGFAKPQNPITAELDPAKTNDPFRFGAFFGTGRLGRMYSSDAEQNFFDLDHMIAFQILKDGQKTDVYVLAWEDARGLGDRDYQDLVVQVSGVRTANTPPSLLPTIPAPAAMGLGSLGLALVGWLRRTRIV